jgi:hypothetical protein
MSNSSRLFAALVAVTLAPSSWATAQVAAPEAVSFSTVDGVTIRGKFYRGPKAAPAVILLHNVGGSETSNHANWIALAKELQTDFSVLAFDFRGHGNSTTVEPLLFLRNLADKRAVPSITRDKTDLDIKSINKLTYPILCNDIAAAKSYLERSKNDLGECNTQNMFLVGSEQGATLGAIWANSEYYRYRCDVTPTGLPRFTNTPEGKYFSGFMWLSISPKVGDRTVKVASLSAMPSRYNATPFCVFAENDTKSKAVAKAIEKTAHAIKKSDREVLVPIKGADKAVGIELLSPSLGLGVAIHETLKKMAKNVSDRDWEKRDFVKTPSAWRMPPGMQPIHARSNFPTGAGIGIGIGIGIGTPVPNQIQVPEVIEKNILFSDYERFIPR